jgi:hypothetical protein
MARYTGQRGMVYLSSTAAGTATAVVGLTSWSIDYTVDMVDVSAFGDTNKQYAPSLIDATGSFEGVWDDTESKLFSGSTSSTGVNIYLYPATNAPTKYWVIPAWLTGVTMEAGLTDAVSVSSGWSARGNISNTF